MTMGGRFAQGDDRRISASHVRRKGRSGLVPMLQHGAADTHRQPFLLDGMPEAGIDLRVEMLAAPVVAGAHAGTRDDFGVGLDIEDSVARVTGGGVDFARTAKVSGEAVQQPLTRPATAVDPELARECLEPRFECGAATRAGE